MADENADIEHLETEKVECPRCGDGHGSPWRELVTKEDYWAIWLGFILIAIGLFVYLPRPPEDLGDKVAKANTTLSAEASKAPYKTLDYYEAFAAKSGLKATKEPHGKAIARFMRKPHSWSVNPLDALYMSQARAEALTESRKALATFTNPRDDEEKLSYDELGELTDDLKAAAQQADAAAAGAAYQDKDLNATARAAIAQWRNAKNALGAAKKSVTVGAHRQILYLIALGVVFAVFFSIGLPFMGRSAARFWMGFPFVFGLAVLAYLFAGQTTMNEYGIGYAAWAIVFGLLISNTVGAPRWVMPAVQTEYYIKTGLVLLGAEILFGKILIIGLPGVFVAWAVTPVVLVSSFLVGMWIVKMPSKTLNVTISSAVSVCGVSAAIATSAACRAKKEELTLAVGMSLIFTSAMMVLMPPAIRAMGMDHVLGGAWMGGTIDATGAVAAAGAFLSDRALYVAATIKMIQNILIGVIAFCVALYWCLKVDRRPDCKVSAMEIWYRFPKFILGFIAASILFSIIYHFLGDDAGYTLVDHGVIRGFTKIFRGWFFCLAFVSIGLATNFRELAHYFKGGKPLWLYIFGQTFNLVLTLLIAWLMFYKIFPHVLDKI